MITICQVCHSDRFFSAIDLGFHPLADTFLKPEQLEKSENTFPLVVGVCEVCGYAGLTYIVPATQRYQENEYSYTSSNSKVSIEHFAELASYAKNLLSLTAENLVVDIGSNVGELLTSVHRLSGSKMLGFEPAANIAQISSEKGIATLNTFFNHETAQQAAQEYGQARLIVSTNTFNHITDLHDFVRGLETLLEPTGAFIFEVPYLVTLLETRAFDTIYLEHVSYFSVHALQTLFAQHNFVITQLATNDYMGGSIRVVVQRGSESPLVAEFLARETELGILVPATYGEFMSDISRGKLRLCQQLLEIKATGATIVGIGAATKGNTLLNYCRLDATLIDYISDTSPLKVGKITPGSHIPIIDDSQISSTDIARTYALILPWNIAGYLQEKLRDRISNFIIPQFK